MTFRNTATPWFVGVLLSALALPALAAEPAVDDLLTKMQAQSIAEGQQLIAELVKRGPEALKAICAKLADPAEAGANLAANAQARFALHGVAMYCRRPDAEADRTMLVGVLLEATAAEKRTEVKTFLINQLQLVGTDDAVAPLAALLADEPLCEPAAQALQAIATPAATEAIVKALAAATAARRLTLARAAGALRAKAAAPELLKDADSQDRTVRLVALWALANSGDPAAADLLAKAAEAPAPYERAVATDALLLLARRLAEAGQKDAAAKIARGLLKSRTATRERNVLAAALSTLVQALGVQALDDVMAAVNHPDKQVRAAALRLAEGIPGEAVTARLAEHLKQAAPPARADLVGVLGRRADRTALPAVLDALKDADKDVRVAAIAAAARLAGKDALAPLLARLDTTEAEEVEAIKRAVVPLPGEDVSAAIAKAVPTAPAAARAALLDLLAARLAKPHLDAVLQATADKDANVRVAAIQALGVLGDAATMPKLVELLLAAEQSRERTTAQRVLADLAARQADAEKRADAVLAALGAAQGEKRVLLLQTLARLGGAKALAAVVADTKSAEAAIQDGAIRSLAEWTDPSAAPELLNVVRTSEKLPHQVLALRGFVRIVGEAAAMPAGEKVSLLKDALAAARRPEEKKLVLGGLGGVRTVEALQVVAPCLEDPALAEEAAAAAVRIACPQDQHKGLRGPEVAAAIEKVAAITQNADLRTKAQNHLKTLTPRGEGPKK
jgi:HEAT repeat protein